MWTEIRTMIKSMKKPFADMAKDFDQMEKDFDSMEKDFKEAEEIGKVVIQSETRPDGSKVVTKTTTVPPPKKVPTKSLEHLLYEQVYFHVQQFWPTRATVINFDGKHYSIGYTDLETGHFVSKGFGDSLEMAVRNVESRYTKTA